MDNAESEVRGLCEAEEFETRKKEKLVRSLYVKNAAILAVIHYLCALSKDPRLQCQCRFYSAANAFVQAGRRPCKHLGNWTDGLQECKCKEAKDAYFDNLKNNS